jgi:glycosyltransferase involved in cell wall biosynthesis
MGALMGRIAVVIPCYRVSRHVLDLIEHIGPEVGLIIVVDDACPEGSGQLVEAEANDARVRVLHHQVNQGVGGAVITGYKAARDAGASVIVKLDGDGQMNPALITRFVQPIISGHADYTKGNRFYNVKDLRNMPRFRIFGNAALSFMTKLSSGYWQVFDPTNGYTALSARLVDELPTDYIRKRYFFESDMLFWLGTLRASVIDIPISAIYADEVSGLKIERVLPDFLAGHLRNMLKRVFYNYFLRGFSVASLELVLGLISLIFGTTFGAYQWRLGLILDRAATTGTVMIAALPIIVGVQLLLSFLNYDIASVPRTAIHPMLPGDARGEAEFLHCLGQDQPASPWAGAQC